MAPATRSQAHKETSEARPEGSGNNTETPMTMETFMQALALLVWPPLLVIRLTKKHLKLVQRGKRLPSQPNWSLPSFLSPAHTIFGPCGLLILPSISLSSTNGPSDQLIPRLPSHPQSVVAQPPVTGATLFRTLWVANLAVNLYLLQFAPSSSQPTARPWVKFYLPGLVRNKQKELSFAHSTFSTFGALNRLLTTNGQRIIPFVCCGPDQEGEISPTALLLVANWRVRTGGDRD
ncbi:Uncharacterized protein Fot_29011 [Forsythia ovata]|uniref:Uncharacterized protein n=1 Tax=Forsythia ovata TaxID=205694 RepID=A0ABD1TQP9_9LAMI